MNSKASGAPQPARSPDLIAAQQALERAALRAREQARLAGGSLVISRGGQVVHLAPGDAAGVVAK